MWEKTGTSCQIEISRISQSKQLNIRSNILVPNPFWATALISKHNYKISSNTMKKNKINNVVNTVKCTSNTSKILFEVKTMV